jgi:hypothetical protein
VTWNWGYEFITYIIISCRQPGSSISIVAGYGLDDRAIVVRIPAEVKGSFPLPSVSRSALGPTQPPVQWVPGVLSQGLKRGRGVTLTTHSHVESRSRMSRSYSPLPPGAFVACSGTALVYYFMSALAKRDEVGNRYGDIVTSDFSTVHYPEIRYSPPTPTRNLCHQYLLSVTKFLVSMHGTCFPTKILHPRIPPLP